MDKKDVVAKLQEYIEVLEDDNTRLESVRVGNQPEYAEAKAGAQILDYAKCGENFDIDFDITYINNVDA